MATYRRGEAYPTGPIHSRQLLEAIRAQRGETTPAPVMLRRRAEMDNNRFGALVLFVALASVATVCGLTVWLVG